MRGQAPEEIFQGRVEEVEQGRPQQRIDNHRRPREQKQEHGDSSNNTRMQNPEASHTIDSIWCQRDVGPVSQHHTMQGFEELQCGFSTGLSATHSRPVPQESKPVILGINPMSDEPAEADDREGVKGDNNDNEATTDQLSVGDEDDHLQQPTQRAGAVFKNLTVKGANAGASFVRTLPLAIVGTFGPDLYHIICKWIPALRFGHRDELRTLINDFTGVVRHGEMMLVLGRPGSGCSTFLRVIANNRGSYASVEGEVSYSGIRAEDADARCRNQVVYNGEDDHHLPTLTVGQTLKFPFLSKTKKDLEGDVESIVDSLLRMCAIQHTRNVLVGNEYVRGVSGGERKRVSIAETLATKSTLTCWDNSTRGLDASTALGYANSLRIMTDASDRITITTLYQAGESIYKLMDKVLVIDEGRMLYQGPASEGRRYFEDLGFYASPQQTTAEFLTSVCDPDARRFRPGYEDRCPKTAVELEEVFRISTAYKKVLADVEDFEYHLRETDHADGLILPRKSHREVPHPNHTESFFRQVLACTRREFWLIWGDKAELCTKYFTIISNGLIVSSMFYRSPPSTDGVFIRSGVVFFSIVFLGWLQLAELMKAVTGRVVIARHAEYGFYRPSSVSLARALTDFPMLIPPVVIFNVIVYFMTNLDREPGKFFTYLLFSYTSTICLTALYRMMAALSPTINDAVRFTGTALDILLIYAGYVIAKPVLLSQKIWFGWILYINPVIIWLSLIWGGGV